jgi:two-component system sensor histidine kinase PilS (NtrC family)
VLQLPEDALADGPNAASRRLEVPFTAADGKVVDIGLTVAPLRFPEGTAGHLVTFQDITEVKRLERQTRLRQRLAAVGEMAAGIAHEIRNPLASMAGSLEVLRHELALTGEQAELMDIALRESARLNERLRLFLAYARPERLTLARLDVRVLIEDAAERLRHSVDIRDEHAIVVDVPSQAVWIEGDEAELGQVLWSLGTNGLRAMSGGGRLLLSARVEPQPGGSDCLVLVVQDDGCGIPADQIDEVFQPFRSSFRKGSGLGLAIVDRIVTDHGGRVEVSSMEGVGTTVNVRLPVTSALRVVDRRSA